MENVVSSWPSLCLWTILTVLEYVGKCVPVIDQIVDGVEAFIVPVLVCVCYVVLCCVVFFLCVGYIVVMTFSCFIFN